MRKLAHTIRFGILAALLIGGTYCNTLDNRPTNWDDPILFTNASFHGLTLENLRHAFAFRTAATFQPLRDLSYMIDFSLWGPHVLLGLHLHSILLYLLMTIGCFGFLRMLCRAFDMDEERSFFFSAMASLVFAVHPVHVESVAWLYARKAPLLGLFTFVSLWAFLKARIEKNTAYYGVSAITLIMAVLAQPTAVVIPAALLFLDIAIMLHRREPPAWIKRGVFYGPLIVFAAWQALRLILMMRSSAGILPYHGGSFLTNLLAVSQIFITYIKLIGFSLLYAADYPIPLYTSLTQWQAWFFILMNTVLITSAVLAFLKRHFLYAFFVFWFYLFLLPVSNILPLSQTITDRYALLPSLSWCVLIGFCMMRLRFLVLTDTGSVITPAFPKLLAYALSGLIIAGYAALTVRQNDVWQNAQTLWEHTVAFYPNSFPGNVNLSIVYINQKRCREAEQLCANALVNLPYGNLAGVSFLPLTNLAMAQMCQGKYADAARNYQAVLKMAPTMPQANLGVAHCYWEQKAYPEAYRQYRFILARIPIAQARVRAEILYRAGFSAWRLGREDEALDLLDRACSSGGGTAAMRRALADVYARMGRYHEAQACLNR